VLYILAGLGVIATFISVLRQPHRRV